MYPAWQRWVCAITFQLPRTADSNFWIVNRTCVHHVAGLGVDVRHPLGKLEGVGKGGAAQGWELEGEGG